MAIVVIFEVPGGTAEQYDGIIRDLDLRNTPADGALAHIAGPMEGGWRVVDVWESQAQFDAFRRDRLDAAVRKNMSGTPRITTGPVHAMGSVALHLDSSPG
jgi:hypothetical protein